MRAWISPTLPPVPATPRRMCLERQHRGVNEVPQLVREGAQALGSMVDDGALADAGELRDGVGDGLVEAAIEHAKLVRADGRAALDGELRDDLAHVAVIVDDLRDAQPLGRRSRP